MGFLSEIINKTKTTLPFLVTKIVSILFIFFILGMIIGYYAATQGFGIIIFIIPLAALSAVWYKLDEGFLVLLALLLVLYYFPYLFI